MNEATWPYGTLKSAVADTVNGNAFIMVGDDGQRHAMFDREHAERPVPGQRYVLSFTAGGVRSDYWKIIGRTDSITVPSPLAPHPVSAERDFRKPCDGKVRFLDKKSAVSEARERTGGTRPRHGRNRQRHGRPSYLRVYPCEHCNGWHLTHKQQSE